MRSLEIEINTQTPPHILGGLAVGMATKIASCENKVMIVGGTAYDLLAERDLNSVPRKKENGEDRDVDVIHSPDINWHNLLAIATGFYSGAKIDDCLSGQFCIRDGAVAIKDGHVVQYVNPKIFSPVFVAVNKIEVPIVRPQTLREMLLISYEESGRSKDKIRAEGLREVFPEYPLLFPESDYLAFSEFREKRAKQYPVTELIFLIDRIRRKTPTVLSPIKLIHLVPGGRALTKRIRLFLLAIERRVLK